LRTIAALAWSDDRYSHLLLIPVISAFLLYFERGRIFSQPSDRRGAGFLFLAGAAGVYALSAVSPVGAGNRRAGMILSVLLVWVGTFALCYGTTVLRAGAFPLGFLAFMVPAPESALNWIIHSLQSASADTSAVLFRVIGMPAFRSGFRFQLPGVEIEIARECSGIRSTFALVLVSVLAATFCSARLTGGSALLLRLFLSVSSRTPFALLRSPTWAFTWIVPTSKESCITSMAVWFSPRSRCCW
jgi:exosortase